MRDHRIRILFLIIIVGVGLLLSGCGKDKVVISNRLPQGQIVTGVPNDSIGAGEALTLTADYTDPDGDAIEFYWTAPAGRITDPDSGTTIWNAPDKKGKYFIHLSMFDGTDSLLDSVRINVDTYTPPVVDYASYYIGYETCNDCHKPQNVGWPGIVDGWTETKHADAFNALMEAGHGDDESCLSCHTTGWDTSVNNGGYDEVRFTTLEGMQCENCHHPGSLHWTTHAIADSNQSCISPVCHPTEDSTVYNWANRDSLGYVDADHAGAFDTTMVLEMDAEQCGSCHSEGSHYNYYADWDSTAHAKSVDAGDYRGLAVSCGAECHTGFGYLDSLYYANEINPKHQYPLQPSDTFDPDTVSIVCLACHDPHYDRHSGQLREMSGYMCGRCHNSSTLEVNDLYDGVDPVHIEGAMLAGTGGYEYPGKTYENSDHTTLFQVDQCAACHISKETISGDGFSSVTPHTFKASLDNCTSCHLDATDFNVDGVQDSVTALLSTLSGLLDSYPNQTDSLYLEALFNKKFVENDGSKGVHNSKYAFGLLNDAIQSLTTAH